MRWDGAWRADLSMPDMRCTFGIDHPNPVKSWCGAAVTVRKAQGAPSLATPLITMLADDDAVRAAILSRDVLRTASERLVHIVMSTLSVAFARELEQAHADTGIAYIAAPVMGRPDVAAAGKLNVLAAGDPAAIERVRPLLDAIGPENLAGGYRTASGQCREACREFPARLGHRGDGRGCHFGGAL